MHATVALVSGLVMTALPLGACGAIEHTMVVRSITATDAVIQIPGSPAPSTAAAGNSMSKANEWTAGPGGTGLFAVGTQTRDGLAAIPVGRYEVKVAPNAESGTWMLCADALCGPAFQENATVIGHSVPPYSATVYIGPKSRTLWVDNLVLSPAEHGAQVVPDQVVPDQVVPDRRS